MADASRFGFRLEYDIAGGRADPVALAFVKVLGDGTEERWVAHFSPQLAIHYGELMAELGHRAIDFDAEPEED